MDYKVSISGVDKAHQACDWCSTHIGDRDWNIDMPDIGQPKYSFHFRNSNEAVTFALRWI